ncbi:MAG: histidine kinase N-terminal 7TM domain-containing protein [Myxococcota bacterium]
MYQANPYTPFALGAALFTGVIALWVWTRARVLAGRALVALSLCLTVDLVGLAIDLAGATLETKRPGVGLQYLGFSLLPLASLRFATVWSGRTLRPRTWWLLGWPGPLLVLAWLTNDLHHAVEVSNALSPRDGFVMRATVAGWAFWVFTLYAYAVIAACAVLYGIEAISGSALARRQARLLLVGTFVPWVGNALFLTGHAPDPALDVGAFGYAVTVGTWTVALARQRLLELLPAARNLAFEQLLEPVVVVDGQGRVIDANGRFLALAGRGANELVGGALSALFPLPRTGEWKRGERTFVVQRSPVGLLGGELGEVVLLNDVTERIEAEAARSRAAAEATRLARARADFLARMSHEVRTPLYAMLGSTELALDAPLSPPVRELLTSVQRSGDALLGIVDEILDFSRLDARKVQLERARCVDLRALVGDLQTIFEPVARARGLSLRTEVESSADVVQLDGARLRQVLTNLVSNALKFTERGEVVLSLRVSPREDAQVDVRFAVRDTGIGIAPEVLSTIFEPFAQADASISRRFGGSGLGLTIAQRLVELMDGRLRVESAPGQGSTFAVELRASPGTGQPEPAPARPTSAPRLGRVLVVDDHQVTRGLSRSMLEREGCQVQTVATGEAALAACADHRFALILLDLRLPDLEGVEVLRRLRAEGDETAVVWFTADALQAETLREHVQGVLRKPFHAEDLRALLDRFVPRAAAQEPGAELAESFALTSARELELLADAVARGAEAEISQLLHDLKGSAAIVGAGELSALCSLPVAELPAALPRMRQARLSALQRLSSSEVRT